MLCANARLPKRQSVLPQGRGDLATSVLGTVTDTLTTYDPATGIETETITSSTGPTIVRRSLHGVLLSTETTGETTYNSYDAFARVAQTWRAAVSAATGTGGSPGGSGVSPLQSYDYSPAGDLLATHTYTNATGYTTETYAYDLLGNRIATTDAHGSTTYRTYDPLGNLTVEWGATYPVRYTYDTQGRRTSLTTFRTTGGSPSSATDGDTTTWTHDPYSGNCLSKTYADGSTITYTYTPDNLLLRTTYASGKWKENVYDAQRRFCGVIYSSPDMDYELQLDVYGRTVWESNSVCSISYALADAGTATNELVSVADETMSIARTLDGQGRVVGLTMPDSGYEVNYFYVGDGNIENISNDLVCVSYLYSSNRLDVGYSIRLANGTTIQRNLYRDEYRRSLVTNITTVVNGNNVEGLAYSFDAASRPITRNGDTFGYNARSEVVVATIGGNSETHEYDNIGNSTRATFNAVTNMFVANNLNQYTAINRNTVPLWETSHDIDGNMTQCGDWTYTYDAGHQLKYVSSNGVLLVTNYYDAKSRRVRKVTPNATMTFFYDDWNLIEEQVAYANGSTLIINYYWGKDLSGTFQGAGGIGGLLYLTVNGTIYIPCYDNNGNVTRYLDANGNTVAQYTYDAFGNLIAKSGPLADFFRHRFSTKYYDAEIGLYYYGYRFYHPILMRWLNRDPIEEDGGVNLYVICENNPVDAYDELGLWTATAESSGQRRRVYKFEEGDTMKTLAKKVGLDPNEYQKWGRVEKSVKAEIKTSVSVSSNTNPGCYVSVPNVWVEADLLRGGNVWNRVVNIGGTVGSFFGTTLGRYGYHFEYPHTMSAFLMAISGSGNDLYGLTVYAHGVVNNVGEPTGEFGGPKGPFVSQSVLLGMIHGKGYKIAEANMMQCYSWAKIKRNGGTVDFEKKWREVAVKPFGYVGVNALGIDFGGRK